MGAYRFAGVRWCGLVALALSLALIPSAGLASPRHAGTAACPVEGSTLFAGAGTAVTNGVFFPGTAVWDGSKFLGAPHVIPRGCNVKFVNLDPGAVTNGHQILSWKTRRGVPLFRSGYVAGPGTGVIKTAHLKPGVYPYFCPIHYGMWGLLEVKDLPL